MLIQVVAEPWHLSAEMPTTQRSGFALALPRSFFPGFSGLASFLGVAQHADLTGSAGFLVQHDGLAGSADFCPQHDGTAGLEFEEECGQPHPLAWHCAAVPHPQTAWPHACEDAPRAVGIG